MMSSLGEQLRAAREAKGVSLAEVEQATRIRAKFLAAFEANDFSAVPSETQARGFLRNYALYLGLNPDELLVHYANKPARKKNRPLAPPPTPIGSSTPTTPRYLPPRPPPGENLGRAPQIISKRPRWFSPDLLFAMGVTLVIILLLVWAVGQLAPSLTASATPTSALGLVGLPPATNATATPALSPTPSATPEPSTPAVEYVGVNLNIRAEQRIWVSIKVDGAEQFAGLLAPGEMRDFVGQNVIELTTGNGRGTRVIWNGRDQGVLGALGEVVIRLWTVEGMVLPTPTTTPTTTPGGAPNGTPIATP